MKNESIVEYSKCLIVVYYDFSMRVVVAFATVLCDLAFAYGNEDTWVEIVSTHTTPAIDLARGDDKRPRPHLISPSATQLLQGRARGRVVEVQSLSIDGQAVAEPAPVRRSDADDGYGDTSQHPGRAPISNGTSF